MFFLGWETHGETKPTGGWAPLLRHPFLGKNEEETPLGGSWLFKVLGWSWPSWLGLRFLDPPSIRPFSERSLAHTCQLLPD